MGVECEDSRIFIHRVRDCEGQSVWTHATVYRDREHIYQKRSIHTYIKRDLYISKETYT